jgi:FkbM family methyltransferase
MLRRFLSEFGFRAGRKSTKAELLEWSARLDPHWIRPAIELARRGQAEAAGRCLSASLSALRECAVKGRKAPTPQESRKFLCMIAEHLDESRGQCFQDIAALMFASRAQGGFFLEVGTGNGELHSNSCMLERKFGWNGIMFEPDRRYHDVLKRNRNARLEIRPAFAVDGRPMRFLESSRSGALSTLEGFKGEDGRIRRGKLHEVLTVTLNTALQEANAPRTIDYISIDTEGSELEVLAGLDFKAWDVRFMTIEHNYVPGKKQEIARLLAPHGFRPVLEDFSCMDVWLARTTG